MGLPFMNRANSSIWWDCDLRFESRKGNHFARFEGVGVAILLRFGADSNHQSCDERAS